MLLGVIDAVYLDMAQGMGLVGITPKPVFRSLFEWVDGRHQAKLHFLRTTKPDPKESGLNQDDSDGLLRWRRGRVELYLKHGLALLLVAAVRAGIDSVSYSNLTPGDRKLQLFPPLETFAVGTPSCLTS